MPDRRELRPLPIEGKLFWALYLLGLVALCGVFFS